MLRRPNKMKSTKKGGRANDPLTPNTNNAPEQSIAISRSRLFQGDPVQAKKDIFSLAIEGKISPNRAHRLLVEGGLVNV